MTGFRDLVTTFRELDLGHPCPVIVHASLSAFGRVEGGAETIVGALLYSFNAVVMPSFTYKTMIVPEVGPPNNGITYGNRDTNLMAEFYRSSMPVDRTIGVIPEALRRHPIAKRSLHPILSFVGVNAEPFLQCQTIEEPLLPIGAMMEADGWVILLGVDHRVNTSIHYGERLAGRLQFIRWALTKGGVQECPHYPGCSDGFESITPKLAEIGRSVEVGGALVRAFPLAEMVRIIREWIVSEPLALLCDRPGCERCQEVRNQVRSMYV
jgi:aminoglycoside 3-N-acetyltransferase